MKKDNSCLSCINFNFKKWGTCLAFSKGIPFIITSSVQSHKKPLPDQDNDIVFEKIKK